MTAKVTDGFHMSSAYVRRERLLDWLCERVVDVSGLYDQGHSRYDRCFRDLLGLHRHGLVDRDRGRPARWYA
jgi:hypothetical protein